MMECAVIARVAQTPELRTSAAGKSWAKINVMVDQPDGAGEFIDVVVFGARAEQLTAKLSRGDALLVEGRLKVNRYSKEGVERTRLEIIASRCEPPAIGRNRAKRTRQEAPANDAAAPPPSCLSA